MRSRLLGVFAITLAACQVDEPNVSQTQQYAVLMSPPSHNFGSVQVGQMSNFVTLSVNPAFGDNYDVVTAITESCPDFSVSAPGLPAEVYRVCNDCPKFEICPIQLVCQSAEYQTYDFTARFSPTVAGPVSCVVNVQVNNGTMHTITLEGSGTLPPIDVDVQPSAVAFGDVRRNTTSSGVALNVRNAGGQTMTVSSVAITAGPYAIASGPTGSYTLTGGASQPYMLTCTPTATGSAPGNLRVQSNDPATPTVNVPLSCRGIDSNVGLTPSPLALATTRVGEPVQASVAIDNSGIASMQLQSVTVSGTDLELMSAPSPGAYGTGALGNATVRFTAAAAGTQTGTLTVTYDGGQTRTAAITARALATSMALTPDGEVSFGPVCSGQSKTETFTILANDEGSFTVTQLSGVTKPFTVMAPTLPASVQGSGANMVQFMVSADPTAEGTQTSKLDLTTNIPGSTPRTINLSVDALPAGVTPSPAAIDFGSTPAMTTTIGKPIHLSNCATTPATFSNPRIEGPDAGEFAIVAQPDNTTIAANGLASWLVVLSTSSPGAKQAEFVVDHDGGTARVTLDGEGLGEDVGTGDETPTDELSYYSCSAGGSSTSRVWPLVIVLGIALRRRRRR